MHCGIFSPHLATSRGLSRETLATSRGLSHETLAKLRLVSRDSREASTSLARVSRGYDQCTKNKEYLGKISNLEQSQPSLPGRKNYSPKISYTRKIILYP